MPIDVNGNYYSNDQFSLSGSNMNQGFGGNFASFNNGFDSGGNTFNTFEAAQPNLIQNIGTGIQGLSSLYGIYSGIQGLSLARDQYNLQKDAYQTNLANSIASYNTTLADTISGRAARSDVSQEQVDEQVAARSL